ncbi:MAG: helix-turn-helix transcriptional regulator [Bacteroidetes bacterium]|mgnify:CR=1 FL=1|jgi:DNA-binding HxlR family transcriptional regulator|nr:helix-turn-helix transcriptional regulator [Bacteroidota bacterium]
MKQVKESSTNQANKKVIQAQCPVTFTLEKIGGRWKPLIIYNLGTGKKRYNELKKLIPNISEKMLIQHLRELETDNLVSRQVMPVVPPHVEYELTKQGKGMGPILHAMAEWGLKHG